MKTEKEIDEYRKIREERNKLKRIKKSRGKGEKDVEGVCEECGVDDLLYRVNDVLLCEACKSSI